MTADLDDSCCAGCNNMGRENSADLMNSNEPRQTPATGMIYLSLPSPATMHALRWPDFAIATSDECLVKRSVELMRGWTALSKFSQASPTSPAIVAQTPGDATRTKNKVWLIPPLGRPMRSCYPQMWHFVLTIGHDGPYCTMTDACATLLELRRATRLGPQRAKGMLSRLCCGQKRWLSWSADCRCTKTLRSSCQANHPPWSAMVRQKSTLRSHSAVARSQARHHPFARPWGSAIGHWSRKQMFQLTMTFAG